MILSRWLWTVGVNDKGPRKLHGDQTRSIVQQAAHKLTAALAVTIRQRIWGRERVPWLLMDILRKGARSSMKRDVGATRLCSCRIGARSTDCQNKEYGARFRSSSQTCPGGRLHRIDTNGRRSDSHVELQVSC